MIRLWKEIGRRCLIVLRCKPFWRITRDHGATNSALVHIFGSTPILTRTYQEATYLAEFCWKEVRCQRGSAGCTTAPTTWTMRLISPFSVASMKRGPRAVLLPSYFGTAVFGDGRALENNRNPLHLRMARDAPHNL